MDVLLPMNQELTGKAWNLHEFTLYGWVRPCRIASKIVISIGENDGQTWDFARPNMFRPKNGCADAVDADGWYWASPVQHFGMNPAIYETQFSGRIFGKVMNSYDMVRPGPRITTNRHFRCNWNCSWSYVKQHSWETNGQTAPIHAYTHMMKYNLCYPQYLAYECCLSFLKTIQKVLPVEQEFHTRHTSNHQPLSKAWRPPMARPACSKTSMFFMCCLICLGWHQRMLKDVKMQKCIGKHSKWRLLKIEDPEKQAC